jgi:hypothetical protein
MRAATTMLGLAMEWFYATVRILADIHRRAAPAACGGSRFAALVCGGAKELSIVNGGLNKMPTAWYERIRTGGKLTVFNGADPSVS